MTFRRKDIDPAPNFTLFLDCWERLLVCFPVILLACPCCTHMRPGLGIGDVVGDFTAAGLLPATGQKSSGWGASPAAYFSDLRPGYTHLSYFFLILGPYFLQCIPLFFTGWQHPDSCWDDFGWDSLGRQQIYLPILGWWNTGGTYFILLLCI